MITESTIQALDVKIIIGEFKPEYAENPIKE